MRVVIIGQSGQLARSLVECAPNGVELVCLGRHTFDLSCPSADFAAIMAHQPEFVINAAAYTAVDKAESDQEAAFALNSDGPARLAEFTASRQIPLIHVSTDYVFNGAGSRPYVEDDATAPLNIYGKSKLRGEKAVLRLQPQSIILRTSWLFSAHGGNFVKTMLRLGRERDRLRIVADQTGCPTSASDLASCIWQVVGMIASQSRGFRSWGIYHYAGEGVTSWADFAQAIFASPYAGLASIPDIERVVSKDYPTPVTRPRYSVLSCAKIKKYLNINQEPWQAALTNVLARLQESAPR
jgi:dTDP-4-dehydrorhamnose reductase